MNKKIIGILICILFFLGANIVPSGAFEKNLIKLKSTLRVNNDYNDSIPEFGVYNFSSINNALEAASSGDEILVCEGLYTEPVIISKRDITIQGISEDSWGKDSNGSIISEGGFFSIIQADNVTITNLIFTNCSSNPISINHANYIRILQNKIYNNNYTGIEGLKAGHLEIRRNNIAFCKNQQHCIRLYYSDYAFIEFNHIEDSYHGIELNSCEQAIIRSNHIENIFRYDIWIEENSLSTSIERNNFINVRTYDFAIVKADTEWISNHYDSSIFPFKIILGAQRLDKFPHIPIILSPRFTRIDRDATDTAWWIPYYC